MMRKVSASVDTRRSGASSSPTSKSARGDEGAILILALIYIIVISAMVTALTSWVTSDLNNTSKFTSAQAIESAANSATEAALQYVRYTFVTSSINAAPPKPCWTTSTSTGQINIGEQDTPMSVYCSTFYAPLSTKTRTVTISTCLSSVTATACAASPLLQAVVVFNDYPIDGPSLCAQTLTIPTTTTTITGQSTCGTGMTIVSWAFQEAPPTVATVADPTVGSCSLAQLVTVTGTGFSGATSVNFMPGGGDTILTGTGVNVNAAGTIVTACGSIEMTTGTTYQVTVTTPAGTSAPSPLTY